MNNRVQLAELINDPGKANDVPLEAVPGLRAQLTAIDTLLLSRLLNPNGSGQTRHQESAPDGNLLTAEQAAPILGVTARWLYRHSSKLPFARRLSRKVLRFSESGLRKWQAQRRA